MLTFRSLRSRATLLVSLPSIGAIALAIASCAPGLLSGNDRADSGAPDATRADALPPTDDAAIDDASPDGSDGDAASSPITILFASGPSWESYDADGGELGPARPVCLSPDVPANCPPGAVVYTGAGVGWTASLAEIPNAEWIWRRDVERADPADLVIAVFRKTFVLGAKPSGSILIAVDNFAAVQVNGEPVPPLVLGSVTDAEAAVSALGQLTPFDLTPFLKSGPNTVVILAQNSAASMFGCDACNYNYAQNPAGVVFGGTLSSE